MSERRRDNSVSDINSRLSGFFRLSLAERRERLREAAGLDEAALELGASAQALTGQVADRLIENVIGTFALPFGVALNFTIDGVDRIVPMVTEEPSVVAAASRIARLVRPHGGFRTVVDDAITVAQIHLTDIIDLETARANLMRRTPELLERANALIPRMVARGGGARRISVRAVQHEGSGQRFLILHVHLNTCDAMGANVVDHVAEALAPYVSSISGGRVVMRILSNLYDERLARAACEVPFEALTFAGVEGETAARRIVEAWRLADADPYRCVTHNKGVMNGVDAVATALGQDVRAIEAGAHAHAARNARFAPLTRYAIVGDALQAEIEIPMPVTTVGPVRRLHPNVHFAHELLGCTDARALAGVIASVGLANNFGSLHALVTEGIQAGHMRLHERKGG